MLYWLLMISLFLLGCLCGYILHYFSVKGSGPFRQQEKLKMYENMIRSQEKLVTVGKMTAGVAHEVKNALTFVTNFSILSMEFFDELQEMIQQGLKENETSEIEEKLQLIQVNVKKIFEHAQKTKSLMKGMLTHVRQEESEKSLTDIHQLIEEAAELSHYAMGAEYRSLAVTIEKHFDDNLPKIPVISSSITQVLINLLNNAYYSVQQKSKIHGDSYEPTIVLATKSVADEILIIVRDNGEGIPSALVDTIFHPFSSTKPVNIGAGLGLSICRDLIVNQHQGTITVDTEEGKFAEFTVALPK